MTLPVSFVMRNGNTGDAERVTTVLQERAFRSVESATSFAASRRAMVFVKLVLLQRAYARKAKALLEEFPPSPYRDAMLHIPEFILNRSA